ncbi:hypothetical protein GGP41_001738 [Bipolaris sorokiniana]|uniref:Uncharacterized protein n=1 Tax=Cochliobolus sativus TaxID=45130 RepID=A0A8H5ZN01_COCSA|nr:hypothetical protein GGP41_001738 [Bipolaris sorokiniana]
MVRVSVCAAGAGTGAGAEAAASASKQAEGSGSRRLQQPLKGGPGLGWGKQQLAVVRGGSGWAESTTLDEARRKRVRRTRGELQERWTWLVRGTGSPVQPDSPGPKGSALEGPHAFPTADFCRHSTGGGIAEGTGTGDHARAPCEDGNDMPAPHLAVHMPPGRQMGHGAGCCPHPAIPSHPIPSHPAPARDKHHAQPASGAPAPAREPGQTGDGGGGGGGRRVSRGAEEFLEAQLRPHCASGRARALAMGNGQWVRLLLAPMVGSSDEIIGIAWPVVYMCTPHIPPPADILCHRIRRILCAAATGPPPTSKKKGEPATARQRPSALEPSLRHCTPAGHAATRIRPASLIQLRFYAHCYILLYLHDDDPGCRQHSNCKRTSRAARLADDDDDAARFVPLRSRPGTLPAPPSFAAPATHRTHIPAPSACPLAMPSPTYFVLTYSRALLAGCIYMVQSVIAPPPPSNQPWHLLPVLQTPTVS